MPERHNADEWHPTEGPGCREHGATNGPIGRFVAMITQLDPPLPLETPKGPGLAHFVIDYGPESHLLWVVSLDEGGACWTIPNPEIRIQSNWSLRRREKVAAR